MIKKRHTVHKVENIFLEDSLHVICISWVFHIKHKLYNGQKIRINIEIKTCTVKYV